jgi:GMP synthase (glutamine-hydrolysing)
MCERRIAVTSTFFIRTDEWGDIGTLGPILRAAGVKPLRSRRRVNDQPEFDINRHAALLILGDGAAASDSQKHYGEEMDWFQTALEAEIPILGIYHGAQLIATQLDREVMQPKERGGRYIDKGISEVKLTAAGQKDSVTASLAELLSVIQYHQHAHQTPKGAVTLAESTNPDWPHTEAFRAGRCVYGFQFHPEVSKAAFRRSANTKEPWEPVRASDTTLKRIEATGRKLLEEWVTLALA